ncbi:MULTISPECIES: DMT family transporter [unclassified Acinetobacter]|uniref:DMT family transporter n=1 Tax=unclassified Acinetobacter TaxID=196816 RepID=UPI00293484DA|nr:MULTISPECIES: DMT family transporter [unclassified Acinetobacter]WOE31562.1 DMT family transporter [Acinetobacter sp. SAAs470]WOE39759.1 DMT family transporter [Acinetobacter sp. SAAs474]
MSVSKTSTIANYVLLIFIWATTPLAIVWSVSDLYYLWALILRFWIALPIALLLLLVLRIRLPLHKIALHSYLAGAMSFIGSQIFTYMATQYLSSGMIALMFGLAPLIAGLIGFFIFKQKLKPSQWVGMLIALLGLAVISLSDSAHHVQVVGLLLMLCSVSIYALSIFWVKQVNAQVEPMAQATGSILFSVILTFLIVPFILPYAPTMLPEGRALLSIGYVVIMSSLVAMFCYFNLVRSLSATTLSLTTVITPMLAILIGAWLNHETLTMMILFGALILITGLFIYFYSDLKPRKIRRL